MRLIDADVLLKQSRRVVEYDEAGFSMEYNAVPTEEIKNAPTVDTVPVVRGGWLIIHEGIERNLNTWEHVVKRKYFCNRCDYHTGNQGEYFNFCPNCGADMRGEKK